MGRAGLNKAKVIEAAAMLANDMGLEEVTLKKLADTLGIQTPSLYSHIRSFDDLKEGIMNYGWNQLEKTMIKEAVGISGINAVRAMCNSFYEFATENPGVFEAMLWYNKYKDDDSNQATENMFFVLYKVFESLNVPEKLVGHLIRTFRSFLQGFAMLVNNKAFGDSASIKESFDISVEILILGIEAYVGGDREAAED